MLMFGLAMSMRSLSTCAPSANSPARMRRNRSRFSVDAAIAVRTRNTGLRQRPARRAQRLRRLAIDVGESLQDEPFGERVQRVVVIGRVIAVRSPIVAEPADRRGDRILVFDVLLERIGVVEAQVTGSAIVRGEAEIEDDRLRVTEVQVAVGLRWKPRDDAAAVRVVRIVLGNDRAQEVRARGIVVGARARARRVPHPGGAFRNRVAIARCSMKRFVHEQGSDVGNSNLRALSRERPRHWGEWPAPRRAASGNGLRAGCDPRSRMFSTKPVDSDVHIL